mmetsp:Transcript_4519/g.10670  ORF Transcript_4519/g.10670 Transcript_4519/m.10670 type:complete len:528 (+) Transcript_4519:109-1692(+)
MSKVGFNLLSSFPLPQNLQGPPTSNHSSTASTSTTTTKTQNNYGLHHLQTNWPGETGNGRHLDVKPGMTLFQILSPTQQEEEQQQQKTKKSPKTIVIPLFQRRYCWTPVQIELWFQDVYKASQSHATHKAMFKRHMSENNQEQLLCLDGQQRITTTTLLLAAIRGYCRRAKMESTVTKIDELLFGSDSEKIHQWARKQAATVLSAQQSKSSSDHQQEVVETCFDWTLESFPTGWLPQSTEFQTTLVPSYIDRAAYFEILCFDPIQQALENLDVLAAEENDDKSNQIHLHFSSTTKESMQYIAYSTFSQLAKKLLKPAAAGNIDFNAKVLSKLFYNQLHRFSMTYLELLTKNDNLQQIFLWMQEKSVFGMGRLLFNPHPGIDFAPVDLARNLIVSSAMNLPLQEQVEFYTRCWVQPLEGKCKDTEVLGNVLEHFVNRIDQEKGKDRHVGSMEEKLNYYRSVVPPALQKNFTDDMPMMVYGRFHSYVQYKATELESDPNVISRELADVIVQELVQQGDKMGVLLHQKNV